MIIVGKVSSSWSNCSFCRAEHIFSQTGHVNLLGVFFFPLTLKANVKQREASVTLTFYRILLEDNNVLATPGELISWSWNECPKSELQ
jgi:hypothetical protein